MPRTVVIVDDNAPFRASARMLLELEGYDVVGEAGDAASALEVVERLRPDVVLLDVVLPDRLLDALAGVTGVNAALITRAESGSVEFFVSSRASSDSRQTDKTCDLNLSGYCEQVMRQRTRLLVSEASKEAARDESSVAAPDTAYYLGYPLLWPDGELFRNNLRS